MTNSALPRPPDAPKHARDIRPRPQMRLYRQHLLRQLRADLHSDRSILFPVRGFIALGWLRSGVEKLSEPGWFDGSNLTGFLNGQLASGQVVFPFYEGLMQSVFLPHAQLLSWIVLVGELLVGIAMLVGCFTNAALSGGLFMNFNFLLVGVPNPSAFYLVIQLALLLANSGATLGADAWLGRSRRLAWLTARPPGALGGTQRRLWMRLIVLLLCAIGAVSAASAIDDFSPAGSVHDPAVIMTILASMTAVWVGMSYLRSVLPPTEDVA